MLKHIERLDRDLADKAALERRIEKLEQEFAESAISNYEAGRASARQDLENSREWILELTNKLLVVEKRARDAEPGRLSRPGHYRIGTDTSASHSGASR